MTKNTWPADPRKTEFERLLDAQTEAAKELAKVPRRIHADKLHSTKEAASILGYSPRTLEGWRSGGVGPEVTRLPNGRARYRGSHLLDWIDNLREYSA